VIASAGQASTQTPQSTQASISTTALSLTIFIASLGHSGTQDSQLVHFSLSTLAGIYITLSKTNQNLPVNARCYKIMLVLQYKFLAILFFEVKMKVLRCNNWVR
jgi:hypothetical protein